MNTPRRETDPLMRCTVRNPGPFGARCRYQAGHDPDPAGGPPAGHAPELDDVTPPPDNVCPRCACAEQLTVGREDGKATCARCKHAYLPTAEARELARILAKRAGELTAAELFALTGARLGDMDHPKNPAAVRRVARDVAGALYAIVRALLGAEQERQRSPLVIAERPKGLKLIEGDR